MVPNKVGKKVLNFNKEKKKKARVKRKALKLEQKHKAAVKAVKTRTKKYQKKSARRERLVDEAALTLGDEGQMVEAGHLEVPEPAAAAAVKGSGSGAVPKKKRGKKIATIRTGGTGATTMQE